MLICMEAQAVTCDWSILSGLVKLRLDFPPPPLLHFFKDESWTQVLHLTTSIALQASSSKTYF